MEKIIVLGIGNRLMMDDGIGIYLTQELKKLDRKSNIHYLIGESDIDYCIQQIEKATFVIILDAVFSGNEPGDLTVYPMDNLYEYQTLAISPHNLHLFQMLNQQQETIKGFLIGVEPYEIRFHNGLSKQLEEKSGKILLRVKKIILTLIANE